MAEFLRAKAKRKDMEVVHNDFSDFLFASQSKKIKTLDAELPPVVMEEEPASPQEFEQQLPKEETYRSMQQRRALMTKKIPDFELKGNSKFCFHEPSNALVVQSTRSSDVSFEPQSDSISDTKSQYFLPRDPNLIMEEVPSVPSQALITAQAIEDIMSKCNLLEPMEAEEQDALMELKEDREQEYHMTAQLYTSNPVMWSGFF